MFPAVCGAHVDTTSGCTIPVIQQFRGHHSKTLWHLKKAMWMKHPALQTKAGLSAQ
jgi:hypothetical protein